MNLDTALKSLKNWRNAEYFKWKHNIRYDQTLPVQSEEQFLNRINRKTMNPYKEWERTAEYKELLTLLLESRLSNDMEKIYEKVVDNAKTGDDKAVKLFISLQKEIINNSKIAREQLQVSDKMKKPKEDKDDDEDDNDDLIID